MRLVKEETTLNFEQAIDLNAAVEELHGLGSQELNKLLRDSENFTLQRYTEKGTLIQIDMEKLAWSLPLHLIAVLVSPGRDEIRLRYLLRGFRLLHSLCDLSSRQTKLEQILLEEVKVTEVIMDLVFYMLLVLAHYEQENDVTNFLPMLHSTLVACSLHLLTGYISSQWQDLIHVLLAHPKVDVFMDVAFDAVRVDTEFLHIKLSALNSDVLSEKSSPLAAERTAHNLCQQCEASLQFLQSLCQQKLFRDRLLRNKELCKNGGILSLARNVLKLDIPPNFKESPKVMAALSRLKSKVLSILLQLCETESISYLDEVASSPRGMQLAKSVALEVIELLKTAFSRKQQLNSYFENNYPRGLVLTNSMRLADIFSDDSNFRYFITNNITYVLAEILSLPHEDFLSRWCSTDVPVIEEDAALDYDPFVAAGVVLATVSAGFATSVLPNEANTECSLTISRVPQTSYAQQRTSLLVKIIANLHCFVPNICEEEERNLFFNKFLECLQMEPPKSSSGFSLTSDPQQAGAVCKNLGSLLDHASSLIPNMLNEEDVHLLSVFFKQFKSLISPHFEANTNQEQNKFKDSLGWDKFSNLDRGGLHQEAQSRGGYSSPLTRKVDPKAWEVAPNLGHKIDDIKEGISESSPYQDDGMELSRRKDKAVTSRSASESLKEIDKDVRNVETSGSDASSTRGKNPLDQMLDNDDFPKSTEHIKESRFRGSIEENEKSETTNGEEKQRRKRKRNIMNDKQITLIERALLDEPEMQRNAALLQSWADKLSIHGSELTPSQLKNWLNNRKARLARASIGVRASSEGENAFSDKLGGSGQGHLYNSPESPSEEFYVPSTTRRGSYQSTPKFGVTLRTGNSETSEIAPDFVDFVAQHSVQKNSSSLRNIQCEPGQHVSLLDREGKEVGRGKVFQVEGRWHGKSLEETETCVVDVLELKVERWTRLQHPSEAGGTTFDEAEGRNGVMRVVWDASCLGKSSM